MVIVRAFMVVYGHIAGMHTRINLTDISQITETDGEPVPFY